MAEMELDMTEEQADALAMEIIRQANDAGRPAIGITFGNYAGHHKRVAIVLTELKPKAEAFDLLPAETRTMAMELLKTRLEVQKKEAAAAAEAKATATKAEAEAKAAAALAAKPVSEMTIGDLVKHLQAFSLPKSMAEAVAKPQEPETEKKLLEEKPKEG